MNIEVVKVAHAELINYKTIPIALASLAQSDLFFRVTLFLTSRSRN